MPKLTFTLLAFFLAVSAPASAQHKNFQFDYARDAAKVTSLLESIREGHAALDAIKFEALTGSISLNSSEFIRFSLECPISRIDVPSFSDTRQPIFVWWDCTDYRLHNSPRLGDLRSASFWFKDTEISLVKFGNALVVSVGSK